MDVQELVSKYMAKPTQQLRESIIKESIPLIKSIVNKIKLPNSPLCDEEDLLNIGATGLLQALDNYTLDKDVQFNTFAYYRIRGSIIDYLRSIDELSRTNRTRYGAAQEAISVLQQMLGRTPTNTEVANHIDMSVEDYQSLLSTVQVRSALSLDMSLDEDSGFSLRNTIADTTYESPDSQILKNESSLELKKAIQTLSDREQLILALYYYEDYNLREIAENLNLSEARISQIIGKVLMTLKSTLHQTVMVSR
ncbi:sigma-70 family RNA polymerase sigma factor [Balneola vulgaris]|uniref:sigma-70 family RNA polymerase sigma factor n=1 Tax=Balneola vulgaris TaxID=287535 RepID=UPI000382219C|nr:FliA/WhiG family RNA polymerase sigma factor [Balneola vulgaris]